MLTGAALGALLGIAVLGENLVKAEVGSEPLVYGLSAAAGALVGAGIGLLVYEIRHGG